MICRRQKRWELILPAAAALTLAGAMIASAWVCDDAYITFRTVDNFLDGYGLRWNVAERVQTFTHPLWLFLLVPITAATGDPYSSAILLSLVLSLGAVLMFVRFLAPDVGIAVIGIVLLAVSKSFIDYSTSGLENALTHFLLILFIAGYFRLQGRRRQLVLGLVTGLVLLNRMDTILLFLPALGLLFFRERGLRTAFRLSLGLIPFLLWEIFSLFYYGFPFPNTAYAKLLNHPDTLSLARMSANYFLQTALVDPVVFPIIIIGIAVSFRRAARPALPLALGSVIYLLYLVKIGGDFMAGRFFSTLYLLSVVLLATGLPELQGRRRIQVAIAAGLIVLGLLPPRSPLRVGPDYGLGWKLQEIFLGNIINDERAYYYPSTGLLSQRKEQEWAVLGRTLRAQGTRLVEHSNIGFIGFFGGPGLYVLDNIGLGDPLLSRISPNVDRELKPGHFRRYVPIGYWDTLESGENKIASPELAEYNSHLRTVTRGPLLAPERLREIVRFNLGGYDHLMAAYEKSHLSLPVEMSLDLVPPDRIGPLPGGWKPPMQALRCAFSRVIHPKTFEIVAGGDREFILIYFRGPEALTDQVLPVTGGYSARKIYPPRAVTTVGFDSILLFPASERRPFSASISTLVIIE